MALHQLIYSSHSTDLFDVDSMDRFLAGIRSTNQQLSVTGMLLFDSQSFLQVLEGEKEIVLNLYQSICQDKRHRAVTTLFESPIAHRQFPDWSMGFSKVSSEEMDRLEGLNDFNSEFSYLDQIDAGRAKKILQAFANGAWH